MNSLRMVGRCAALTLICAIGTGNAWAQDTATMLVTAEVSDSCVLGTVEGLAFGLLDQESDNTAEADISYSCTDGADAFIAIDGGGAASIGNRSMSGPQSLDYQLFTESGHSNVFGDISTGNRVPVTGQGYGTSGTVTVYGLILEADAAAVVAGSYSDTVNVTIEF